MVRPEIVGVYMAAAAGLLTLIISFVTEARFFTIVYRLAVSLIIFGSLGWLAGTALQKSLSKRAKGQHIDIVSQQENDETVAGNGTFEPFSSNQFEQLSETDK